MEKLSEEQNKILDAVVMELAVVLTAQSIRYGEMPVAIALIEMAIKTSVMLGFPKESIMKAVTDFYDAKQSENKETDVGLN